ncbi:hypothetical protein F0562_005923 [Nyssa sinensis]|uniref:Uncharacterized protein n=1 Tax=Nyssa sinensis TaxID=561372 RepID=A0A5J5ALN1_9ASTE|nr:hypothetical protein F0562_005923 [Nyssa sinensis]
MPGKKTDVANLVILDAQVGHASTHDGGDHADAGNFRSSTFSLSNSDNWNSYVVPLFGASSDISSDTVYLPSPEGGARDMAAAHEIASEILNTLSWGEGNSEGKPRESFKEAALVDGDLETSHRVGSSRPPPFEALTATSGARTGESSSIAPPELPPLSDESTYWHGFLACQYGIPLLDSNVKIHLETFRDFNIKSPTIQLLYLDTICGYIRSYGRVRVRDLDDIAIQEFHRVFRGFAKAGIEIS